jgi:hypothetical protein
MVDHFDESQTTARPATIESFQSAILSTMSHIAELYRKQSVAQRGMGKPCPAPLSHSRSGHAVTGIALSWFDQSYALNSEEDLILNQQVYNRGHSQDAERQ